MRLLLILILLFPGLCYAQSEFVTGQAAAREVYEKVVAAAAFLSKAGEDGLSEFQKTGGRFAWKNTYVFVTQCEQYYCLPGPQKNDVAQDILKIRCYKTDKLYILALCGEAMYHPQGAWTEFWWPRPGFSEPQRKIAFMKQVPNTPYQVVADTFDDKTPLEELKTLPAPQ
jgi:hypothetical protein